MNTTAIEKCIDSQDVGVGESRIRTQQARAELAALKADSEMLERICGQPEMAGVQCATLVRKRIDGILTHDWFIQLRKIVDMSPVGALMGPYVTWRDAMKAGLNAIDAAMETSDAI